MLAGRHRRLFTRRHDPDLEPRCGAPLRVHEQQAIGRSLSILEPASDAHGFAGILERIREGERLVRFDDAHVRADGTRVHVSIVVSPILDASRRGIGVSMIARDVGEAGWTEARFRSLLDSALDAMVIVAEDGTIGLVNAKTEAMFGYSRQELVGRRVELLMPERFRTWHGAQRGAYFVDPRARLMGAGLELFGLHRNGREFPVDISLSPLETEEGVLVTAAIRDVSERKATERAERQLAAEHKEFEHKLVETQKLEALGVLAGGIAHDFNNLLGVILGNTSLALRTLPAGFSAAWDPRAGRPGRTSERRAGEADARLLRQGHVRRPAGGALRARGWDRRADPGDDFEEGRAHVVFFPA